MALPAPEAAPHPPRHWAWRSPWRPPGRWPRRLPWRARPTAQWPLTAGDVALQRRVRYWLYAAFLALALAVGLHGAFGLALVLMLLSIVVTEPIVRDMAQQARRPPALQLQLHVQAQEQAQNNPADDQQQHGDEHPAGDALKALFVVGRRCPRQRRHAEAGHRRHS